MRTCIAAHSGKVRNTGRISFWAVTWNGLEMDPLCGVLLFRKAKSTDLLNQATFNILTKVSILLGNIFNSGVWPLLLKMYGTLPITKSICFKLLYLGFCLKYSSLVIDEWPVIAHTVRIMSLQMVLMAVWWSMMVILWRLLNPDWWLDSHSLVSADEWTVMALGWG